MSWLYIEIFNIEVVNIGVNCKHRDGVEKLLYDIHILYKVK